MNAHKLYSSIALICLFLVTGCGGDSGSARSEVFDTTNPFGSGSSEFGTGDSDIGLGDSDLGTDSSDSGSGSGSGDDDITGLPPELVWSTGSTLRSIRRLRTSSDGGRYVFLSDVDPRGTNPNNNFQVFTIGFGQTDPVQITPQVVGAIVPETEFDIDGSGNTVVFVSEEDTDRM